VRERLRASYSDTGRPSIDPKLLLRIVLIGYFATIDSRPRTERTRIFTLVHCPTPQTPHSLRLTGVTV
jgi:hypothetical protein